MNAKQRSKQAHAEKMRKKRLGRVFKLYRYCLVENVFNAKPYLMPMIRALEEGRPIIEGLNYRETQ